MEGRKLEIVIIVGMVIFAIAIVGASALFLLNGIGVSSNNSSAAGGPAGGLIGFIDSLGPKGGEQDFARLYGNVTVNGEVPRLEARRLADGTTYGGVVTLNYLIADKYMEKLAGTTSTGSLIDSETGAYSVDDVVRGVPFTVKITLYTEAGTGPLIRDVTIGDGSRAIYTLEQNLESDFDLAP